MFKAFKKAEFSRGPFRRLSESEILLFVSRTMRSRDCEPDTPDVLGKLQSLNDILDQHEIELLDWPDSPGKDRLYASLLKAKGLAVQIADYLAGAAKVDGTASDKESA